VSSPLGPIDQNAFAFAQLEAIHNLSFLQTSDSDNYEPELATVYAQFMFDIYAGTQSTGYSFAQQYYFHKGIKLFGKRGEEAAMKEYDQLHKRNCFTPVDVSTLTPAEKKKAQNSLMLLSEKSDKTVKGRLVYEGSKTRQYFTKEENYSPTASNESIFLTAVIDAHENRDVMTNDIPNAFIQAHLPNLKDGDEKVVMKTTGKLVDLLVRIAPNVYGPFVVFDKGRKVIYLQVLKALYGMLQAALLWYKKFRSDLEEINYVFNPYDGCVANRNYDTNGVSNQHTIRFHVDDLMCSHVDPQVNTNFYKWLNRKYGHVGEVKCTRGKIHKYLGMTFDFSLPGKVQIDMEDYVDAMLNDFPIHFSPEDALPTPAEPDLLQKPNSPPLPSKEAAVFHTFVMKGMYLCKRARPDVQTAIAALCTRCTAPTHDDWRKLLRLMKFLYATKSDKLILAADDLRILKWCTDVSFAVHPDFKSNTGTNLTLGHGCPVSSVKKQTLNTRSSTEGELVGTDDASPLIFWTVNFMTAQGYPIKQNILFQDNKSTILLLNNGKKSSTQRTRALNIRYFFLTDQIEKGNLEVLYCPTDLMLADYMSKPLQGKLFSKFRRQIMGHDLISFPPAEENDRSVLDTRTHIVPDPVPRD
jgi:hypothetical protein